MKDDRHQNIISNVVLKKGVEESWSIERVATFIDLLRYREITLKSDTGPAIVAFRNRVQNRVAEMCKAEVTTEDAVQGNKESNGLIENAVMLSLREDAISKTAWQDADTIVFLLVGRCWQNKSPQIQ